MVYQEHVVTYWFNQHDYARLELPRIEKHFWAETIVSLSNNECRIHVTVKSDVKKCLHLAYTRPYIFS